MRLRSISFQKRYLLYFVSSVSGSPGVICHGLPASVVTREGTVSGFLKLQPKSQRLQAPYLTPELVAAEL